MWLFARMMALGVVFTWIHVAASGGQTPKRLDGYTVVRVETRTNGELEQVLKIAADVWSETEHVGPMDVMMAPGALATLDAMGLPYTVRIADVQKLIDEQHAGSPRGWFDAYHPYEEIVDYLNQLVSQYPSLAQMVNVGTSLEERPIWGIRIAGPDLDPMSPAVVYFCAVHAREWITTTVPPYLATHLLENYGTDFVVTDLVDHVEWILIPVANPDGYVFSWGGGDQRLWRKNRRDNGDGTWGVDINRNWGFGWGGQGSSGYTSSQTYRGPEPFSEPETRVLRDMFITRPNVRAQLDIHSYSQVILWPWGHTPEFCPDHDEYEASGLMMQQLIEAVHGVEYDIGPIYTGIYPVSGDSLDWTYGVRGILSYSFELRDTGLYGFLLPADQIIPNNEELLPALTYLAGTSQVRATQISFPEGLPDRLVAGEDTTILVAITSGLETLDPSTASLHYRYDPAGPFTTVPLSPLGGAAFEAVLPATHCASSPEFYISVTGEGGTTVEPADAPASVHTAFMVSGMIVFEETLAEDPAWETEGQWAWGRPTGGGGLHGEPDPTSGHTGDWVYGYNLDGDYENNMPAYHLTSTPIDCTRQFGLRLSFWRWLGVEQAPYDHASVRVSNDGESWVTVWENTEEVADAFWTPIDVDISPVADNQPNVYLRWTLGPTDSGWAYCGWNIDDVQIYATGCVGRPGDSNGDGVVDLSDLAEFGRCLSGPAGGIVAGCGVFDFEDDDDVDLDDFGAFQSSFGGP